MILSRAIPLILAAALPFASAHGRLEVPASRGAQLYGKTYEDDPVTGGVSSVDWVCREEVTNPTPYLEITAGSDLELSWDFGAAHVGDCSLYMSYDYNLPRSSQKFFKIANFPECNKNNRETVAVHLPAWLPAGQAVLRWDWYALHVTPKVEFYVQCIDVTVVSSSTKQASDIPSYIIPGLYPADNNANEYRGVYEPNVDKVFITGPACVGGVTGNCCNMTAYVDGSGYNNCKDFGTSGGEQSDLVCETYTVVYGDTLSSIAQYYKNKGYKVSANQICRANDIPDCMTLDVGEKLTIPIGVCASLGASNSATVVQTSAAFLATGILAAMLGRQL